VADQSLRPKTNKLLKIFHYWGSIIKQNIEKFGESEGLIELGHKSTLSCSGRKILKNESCENIYP
jgi:hypothetical protein